ncbi:hypothetical protein CHARACLAT_003152 [Characodon lateralis]|uniref:Uncharacterized protein n=1 Tax=Characodon lateralis TaxID=208331 RepID=A0ABU7CXT7_9TELE|nr:hypothetical protein [Characodon lateralis]
MCHRHSGRHNLCERCDVEDMRPKRVPVSGSNSISLLEHALSLTSLALALTQMNPTTPPPNPTQPTTATTTSHHHHHNRRHPCALFSSVSLSFAHFVLSL